MAEIATDLYTGSDDETLCWEFNESVTAWTMLALIYLFIML
jgi:hypothetical protein